MSKIAWSFAKNEGGRDSGFHDAGVETFKGNIDRYLARELGQNSLDARSLKTKPVGIKFELLDIPREDIPDIDSLQHTFYQCGKYWKTDKKAHAFFAAAQQTVKSESIRVLRVGDYNTLGVCGNDDERKKSWYNLIRCAGSSAKEGGEGGSFGIGKNAPFAASTIRTVLYSTYTYENTYSFVGVATLVSHELSRGGKAQPVGYLGGAKGSSVTHKKDIPSRFVRKERGTDVYILGFEESASWEKDLVFSILDNFWPAVNRGDLEVTVGTTAINRKTLAGLMEKFSVEPDFTAHLYYKAYTAPDQNFTRELENLGEVSAFLITGDYPKRVAMVRKTGMVIFHRLFRSPIGFCGVFECKNEKGNIALREMEPPRHDVWDPDHPTKGKNRLVEAEYVGFVRDCISKLAPADDSAVLSIPEMGRFLPDDDETPEEGFGDASVNEPPEEYKTESAVPNQLLKIVMRKLEGKRKATQPSEAKPDDGEQDTEAGNGKGSGGGGGKNKGTGKGDGGGGAGGGGKGQGNAGDGKGGIGGISSKPAVPIRARAFCAGSNTKTYTLAVGAESSQEGKSVHLLVWSVGDDQKLAADIVAARVQGGAPLDVLPGGIIGPFVLEAQQTTKIDIELRQPKRLAFEFSAHEAES